MAGMSSEQLTQMLSDMLDTKLKPVHTKLGHLSQQVEAMYEQVEAVNLRQMRQGWDAGGAPHVVHMHHVHQSCSRMVVHTMIPSCMTRLPDARTHVCCWTW